MRLHVAAALGCSIFAWSLPLAFVVMGRLGHGPSARAVAVTASVVTLLSSVAALVLAARRDDEFAEFTLVVVLLLWTLPSVVAVGSSWIVGRGRGARLPHSFAAVRSRAGWVARALLVVIGAWLVVLPVVAGFDLDDDVTPIFVLLLLGGPGVVMVWVGVASMWPEARKPSVDGGHCVTA